MTASCEPEKLSACRPSAQRMFSRIAQQHWRFPQRDLKIADSMDRLSQIKENVSRPCPICANKKVELLHHQKLTVPQGYPLPSEQDVVWCPVCGFAYADTAARQEDYDRYYGQFSKYEDDSTSTGGGGSEWDLRRLRETAAAVAEVLPRKDARILDIGCANGGLLRELKNLGFTNLVGVDPSASCVRRTAEIEGVEAQRGSFREMPPGIGKFDLVMLSHVLEHVADLNSTVEQLTTLLDPGALLYIEVPDASRYAEFLVAPFQDFNTEHINHFDPASLRVLFEQHGFAMERMGQKEVDSSPGCPYPALFEFFRYEGRAEGSPAVQYSPGTTFRDQLLAYIAASREIVDGIDAKLAPLRDSAEPVIVWGTGQLAMKLLAETSLAKMKIQAFVDGNPVNQGKKLQGVSVLAPDQITDLRGPILITTLLHQAAITDVIRNKLGLDNPIYTLE